MLNSHNNTIINNSISKNTHGMSLNNAKRNNITFNIFSQNEIALNLFYSNNNTIAKNNFVENKKRNAQFRGTIYHKNQWSSNYWNRFRLLPKPIFGRIGKIGLILWINYDKTPVREPYTIHP